jgi:hypothetical protein
MKNPADYYIMAAATVINGGIALAYTLYSEWALAIIHLIIALAGIVYCTVIQDAFDNEQVH